jgi:hypothetical protein
MLDAPDTLPTAGTRDESGAALAAAIAEAVFSHHQNARA